MSRKLAAILFLCAAVGVSLVVSVRGLRAKVSAQDLLLDAVRDGGPLEDIFAQQAGQGYYNDALATARLATLNLLNQERELSGWIKKLITIRAQNGDVQGAKEMINQLNRSGLAGRGPEVTLAIAKIQVDRGDLDGALGSCVSPEDRNEVMENLGAAKSRTATSTGRSKPPNRSVSARLITFSTP